MAAVKSYKTLLLSLHKSRGYNLGCRTGNKFRGSSIRDV